MAISRESGVRRRPPPVPCHVRDISKQVEKDCCVPRADTRSLATGATGAPARPASLLAFAHYFHILRAVVFFSQQVAARLRGARSLTSENPSVETISHLHSQGVGVQLVVV